MANTKIPSELIADSSITAAKLADGTITTADIADSNVTTAKIADSNVTTAKIGDAQVTTAKIVDANVTTAKIADSNVTTAKILDNNITSAKLASALTLGGNTTFSGNIIKDSGHLTLDSPGDIHLDVSGQVKLDKNGTLYGNIFNSSNSLGIHVAQADKDIIFSGNDGGSTVNALTLDMSDAGAATFNSTVTATSVDVTGAFVDSAVNRGIKFDTASMKPSNGSGGDADNHVDLGTSSARFKNLHLAGTIASGDIEITSTNRDMLHLRRNSSDGDAGINFENTSGNLGQFYAMSNGNFFMDASNEVILDSSGGIVRIYKDGGNIGAFQMNNNDFYIRSMVSDKDIIFQGYDGSSNITALSLDMSEAGAATFNNSVTANKLTILAADGVRPNDYVASFKNQEATNSQSFGVSINAGSTSSDIALNITDHDASNTLFRILGNGNVGIGTSSPYHTFDVFGAVIANGAAKSNGLFFDTTSATTGTGGGIALGGYSNGTGGAIYHFGNIQGIKENSTAGNYASAMLFSTRANGATPTERMRIDSSGDVLIGQTSQTGYAFAQKLVVGDGDDNDGITIQSGATHQGNLAFNHSDGTTAHGRISYQHQTNYMQFFVNNDEKMRINSSGKVGISTTASLSGSDYGMLTIKKTGSNIFGDSAITINSADTNQSTLALGLTGSVAYIDSTESGSGTVLPLVFATASTERMRLDSNGYLRLLETSKNHHEAYLGFITPNGGIISEETGAASRSMNFVHNGYVDTGNEWTYMHTDEASLIQHYNGATTFSNAAAGTADTTITWNERMRINSNGKVGINKIDGTGMFNIQSNSEYTRLIELFGSGTSSAVASLRIGISGNNSQIAMIGGVSAGYAGLSYHYYYLIPQIQQSDNNGDLRLGGASNRFHTVYSVNGVSTSDERVKEEIENLDVGLDFIKSLKPKKFKYKDKDSDGNYKDGKLEQKNGVKKWGLVAQDVKKALEDNSITEDIGLWSFEKGECNGEVIENQQQLQYQELISPLIKAIQEQQTIIDDLKSRIETLEG